MNNQPKLIEGIDYTINTNGDFVFTAYYHLKRGHCCQSGCINCPYGYSDKIDPNIPAEYNDAWEKFKSAEEENEGED